MKSKPLFALVAVALCAFAQSCDSDGDDSPAPDDGGTGGNIGIPSGGTSSSGGSGFTYDGSADDIANSRFSKTITIEFSANAATVRGEADSVDISTDGAYVSVVSHAAEVEYVLRGETGDGALKVYSDKKYKLTLDGVKLASRRGSAINNQGKKRLFVFLADGTTNSLADASSYVATPSGEDEKAALFSEGQIVFCGAGELEVTGNYKHAICSDDYVVVSDQAKVSVLVSKKDGIHANDYVAVLGGSTTIMTTGDDGVDVGEGYFVMMGGTLSVSASAEASKALKAAGNVFVQGGSLQLTNAGEPEYEADEDDYKAAACLASDSSIFIEGGEVVASCSGVGAKGLKADGAISVSGGSLTVVCSGASNDYVSSKGVKAEGDISISGGQVSVTAASHEGIESKSRLSISGGVVEVEAYDDAINSGGDMRISGGRVYARGKTNDALDANGNLIVEGGLVVAYGASAPECGLDANEEEGFRLYVTGGTVLGVGGGTSYPASAAGSQPAVAISASLGNVALKDADGNVVLAWECEDVSTDRMGGPGGGGRPGGMGGGWTYFVSTPGMVSGGSYTLHSGVSISADDAFHGLSTGGVTVSGGTAAGSATASVTAGGR